MAPQMADRLRASGLHLLISLCVAALSAALVFLVLYPTPLAQACGVTEIFLLLLVVDISLGPLITLCVFNRAKPELKRDLLIVGLIQLAALCYGLHTVYIARPAYVVFAVDRFDLMYANDLDDAKLAPVTLSEFKQVPLLGPKTVAAILPADSAERSALTFSSATGGADLHQLPKYYRPLVQAKADIIAKSRPLAELNNFNRAETAKVTQLAEKYRARQIDAGFLPLKGKAQDVTVLINRADGTVLEMVDLRPWL